MIMPGHVEAEARLRKPRPIFDYAMVAELSALHELSALAFAESEAQLAQETVEKVGRLFGARGFAVLTGLPPRQRMVMGFGFKAKEEVLSRLTSSGRTDGLCSMVFNAGTDDQDMVVFEQARALDDRIRRLYGVMARRLEDRLAAFRLEARRRRIEEDLSANLALLRIAGKSAAFGGWSVDVEANRLDCTDETAALHGLAPGRTTTLEDAFGRFAPEWRERVEGAFGECAASGKGFDETVEILGADGQRRWVRLIGEALRDESGAIARIHGAIQDVSDRRWLEEALAESEGKYRLLAEDVAALICEFGCDGAIAFANRAYAEFFGCAETGIEGRSHWDLLSGGEGAAMRERLAAMEPAAPLAEVTVETGTGIRLEWRVRATFGRDGRPERYRAIGNAVAGRAPGSGKSRGRAEPAAKGRRPRG